MHFHCFSYLATCKYIRASASTLTVDNSRFTEEQVEQLDKKKQWSRALDGSDYLPGMVLFFCS